MKIIKTPTLCRKIFPSQSWRFSPLTNDIYLTFDDGPIQNVTPWVLDFLKQEQMQATFFCIGENVQHNPNIYQRILDEGHSVGNHTMNHFNGWKTPNKKYFENIEAAAQLIQSDLFRPPYGKIKKSQVKQLKNKYKIVMWSYLSYDFDENADMNAVFTKITKTLSPGAIIVFHDSLKAEKQLKIILPKLVEWMKKNNFQSKAIE